MSGICNGACDYGVEERWVEVVEQRPEFVYLFFGDYSSFMNMASPSPNFRQVSQHVGAPWQIGSIWKESRVSARSNATTAVSYMVLVEAVPFKRLKYVQVAMPPRKQELVNISAFAEGKNFVAFDLEGSGETGETQIEITMKWPFPMFPIGCQFLCCLPFLLSYLSGQMLDSFRALLVAVEGLPETEAARYEEVLRTNPLFTTAEERVTPAGEMEAPPSYEKAKVNNSMADFSHFS